MATADQNEVADIVTQIEQKNIHESRLRTIVGLGFVSMAAAASVAFATHQFDDVEVTRAMPFRQEAQTAINSVDGILASAGAVALVLSMAEIGAVKIGALKNTKLRAADKRSSQELTDDGHRHSSLTRRALRTGAAGTFPVIVAVGAGLGTLTAAIGNEITEGPSRPIEAFAQFAEGRSMVVQFPRAMPMQESIISSQLTNKIKVTARNHDVEATSIDLGLGNITYGSESRTGLFLGIDNAEHSALNWEQEDECKDIPVLVDRASNINNGKKVFINGVEAQVIGQTEGTSAINRIGVVMDQEALSACIKKSEEEISHAVVLDTDLQTAKTILDEANIYDEPSAVITKDTYIDNSETFWRENVKPITNVLAGFSMLLSFVAMAGTMGARMMRNRRELAAKLAAGESDMHLRFTEQLRATKDGVLGATIGIGATMAIAPFVNMVESGMKIGVGFREVMVGYGVGIIGSVAGAMSRIIRPSKTVNPSEFTRI